VTSPCSKIGSYAHKTIFYDPRALKTSDYEGHNKRIRSRVSGTCEWILRHYFYREWREITADEVLWLSADPEWGKSVLSRFLVDDELAT
jgi:hypothetical protein